MTNEKQELKEYADGWMTEVKNTDVPVFLKLAFPVIALGATAYIVMQMFGDQNHATRGTLVKQFNQVSQTSPVFQYVVMALALVYALILIVFTYKAVKED